MLSVLKGLSARDLRVFNVEPNYWWHNYGQEFIEFAYIQVWCRPRKGTLSISACEIWDATMLTCCGLQQCGWTSAQHICS